MSEKVKRRGAEHQRSAPGEGFIKGLTELVEKLGDLAETGRELRKARELGGADDKMKAVYGLRVKLGLLGGDAVDVEPFGDIKFDKTTRRRDEHRGRAQRQEVSQRNPVAEIGLQGKRLDFLQQRHRPNRMPA